MTSTWNGPMLVSLRSSPRVRDAAHDMVDAVVDDKCKTVRDAEVGVLTQAGDEEQLVAARMTVEVVAIVEVAVAGSDLADRLGHLMDRKIVQW